MKKIMGFLAVSALIAIGAQAMPANATEDGGKLFKKKCAMCHKVDRKKVGPAVKSMTTDEATLKSFVKRQKVSYPIASSKGVRLPEPYALIRAIPTTFFIDRKGIIQKVVVGYHDFEDLKRLALGPDYAGESKPAPNSTRSH